MTDSEILTAVETVLNECMAHAHMDGFGPDARLNEDLYLDSVLILQIFLNLELEYGLAVPEEAIAKQDIVTVADLVALYLPKKTAVVVPAFPLTGGTSDEGVHGEAYYDIKVHCFVSCVCDGLKRQGLDQRPFYFGVWDAKFAVSDRFELLYHAPEISQEFFRSWFERLYGVTVVEWYDPDRTKLDNLAVLLDLVRNRSETGSVMVMLDMFHLPERENKFNQNPFPHYLMLQETADSETWFVHDPDYRWEGEIAGQGYQRHHAADRRRRLCLRSCRGASAASRESEGLFRSMLRKRTKSAGRLRARDRCRASRRTGRYQPYGPCRRGARAACRYHPEICLRARLRLLLARAETSGGRVRDMVRGNRGARAIAENAALRLHEARPDQ
ncbi:Acyl carrier protein [Sinorhizobium fredii CCBAU 25509]|nr:Acyl carrier protein [Sinorhizobium fredii CCBAU 25509]